jgi:hypothetical protein
MYVFARIRPNISSLVCSSPASQGKVSARWRIACFNDIVCIVLYVCACVYAFVLVQTNMQLKIDRLMNGVMMEKFGYSYDFICMHIGENVHTSYVCVCVCMLFMYDLYV